MLIMIVIIVMMIIMILIVAIISESAILLLRLWYQNMNLRSGYSPPCAKFAEKEYRNLRGHEEDRGLPARRGIQIIYIYIYICLYKYVYIYIYRERDVYMYMYTYTYMYTHVYSYLVNCSMASRIVEYGIV